MITTLTNVLLCPECTQAAVNDDYTSLDYHYSPEEAEVKMRIIQFGLARLGPGLSLPLMTPTIQILNFLSSRVIAAGQLYMDGAPISLS